jgi:hypothetical protein
MGPTRELMKSKMGNCFLYLTRCYNIDTYLPNDSLLSLWLQKRIRALMKGMAETEKDESFVSKAAVGSIVGLQFAQIQQMASEYEEKRADLEAGKRPDKVMGAQAHKRTVAALQKQIVVQEKKVVEGQVVHDELQGHYTAAQTKLEEVEVYSRKIAEEMEKLNQMETDENREVLEQLRSLVAMNESLKRQEAQFKAHCREEKTRLEGEIERLQLSAGRGSIEDQERTGNIMRHYEADKERMQKIRALLARKNREIAQLQRKIDEVPSRTEMAQYQRRFIELYNQVASTLTETKQFYTLYNTLEDQKEFMEKEVEILNNIHEKFELGMSTGKNKELFLRQVQEILNGVKQDRERLEKRRGDEKMEKDRLNGIYLELVEKQRAYYKTVRDFQEECRRNEILVSKLKAKASR